MLAPPAQWNAIFLLFHRGEIAKQRFKNEPISLGFTPLNFYPVEPEDRSTGAR